MPGLVVVLENGRREIEELLLGRVLFDADATAGHSGRKGAEDIESLSN